MRGDFGIGKMVSAGNGCKWRSAHFVIQAGCNRHGRSPMQPLSMRPEEAPGSPAVAPVVARRPAPRRALFGWVMFDWAGQPFFTLIATFVFAPYFASAVAPDPVTGQAWWGFATGASGVVLALLSPVLGSISDATGAKKPWIAAFGLLLVLSSSMLWLATPGAPMGVILLVLASYALANVAAELAAVFNNAMMPTLAPPERLGRLSGTGWAVGYLGGLVSLVVVLGFLAASPETGRTILGFAPLFGLDPAMREGDRIVGPLTALWFVAFVMPLMVFTPDLATTRRNLRDATREGLTRLKGTIGEARREPSVWRFLLANMVYQDGLVALFAFGGIYGAGVFGWTTIELGLFGILLTITGTAGALIGGRLDDRMGPKTVITGSLVLFILVCIGILSLGREHILFVIPVEVPADGGLFAGTPERIFLALGLVIGAVAGPVQAASRSLLVRIAPVGEVGRYFGLLALSGKMTSFAGPVLVAVATTISGTQAAGPAVLILFFATGLFLLRGVHPRS
jgi:MFS transporter, UMF1 family